MGFTIGLCLNFVDKISILVEFELKVYNLITYESITYENLSRVTGVAGNMSRDLYQKFWFMNRIFGVKYEAHT